MTPTKQEWINSLVERRRNAGGHSEEELDRYRAELEKRYAPVTNEAFKAAMEAKANV